MTLDPIGAQDLKHETWYYGLLCNCGRRLALHEDVFAGNGDEFLHFPAGVTVDCACGARLITKRLEKFKHSRHRT
jgi:hypothetical protein